MLTVVLALLNISLKVLGSLTSLVRKKLQAHKYEAMMATLLVAISVFPIYDN